MLLSELAKQIQDALATHGDGEVIGDLYMPEQLVTRISDAEDAAIFGAEEGKVYYILK